MFDEIASKIVYKDKGVNRGKRSKKLNEVKTTEIKNKNLQHFLEKRPVQKEVLLHINCKTMHMSSRILLDKGR